MEKYRNPVPTVDVIVTVFDKGAERVVLIKRKNPPFGYALPGGFVDEGEPLAAAARREALEEIGIVVELTELFHCYSDPSRDPRQHTISTVFLGTGRDAPVAGDDAAEVLLADPRDLPPLAFDHGTVLQDWLRYRETGARPPVDR